MVCLFSCIVMLPVTMFVHNVKVNPRTCLFGRTSANNTIRASTAGAT